MRKTAVLAAAVFLIAGCSTGAVTGSPVAGSPDTESPDGSSNAASSDNELFEPCNVPDDALRAAGVDPAFSKSSFDDGDHSDWDICTWNGTWYYLAVLSTTHTFDEIKANPNSKNFVPVSVGDRDAVGYTSSLYEAGRTCDVAFAWQKGSVVVRASRKTSQDAQEDLCAIAAKAANTLDASLPR